MLNHIYELKLKIDNANSLFIFNINKELYFSHKYNNFYTIDKDIINYQIYNNMSDVFKHEIEYSFKTNIDPLISSLNLYIIDINMYKKICFHNGDKLKCEFNIRNYILRNKINKILNSE